ncbi:hypothetical protein TNCV_1968161 [Trichonephila clavipes]|nr:hypothetical protein TNCV_1968161 [Trichonephila clavipes]
MNNATPVPTSSEMKNIMESMFTYLEAHSNGKMNNRMNDIEQFDAKKDNPKMPSRTVTRPVPVQYELSEVLMYFEHNQESKRILSNVANDWTQNRMTFPGVLDLTGFCFPVESARSLKAEGDAFSEDPPRNECVKVRAG